MVSIFLCYLFICTRPLFSPFSFSYDVYPKYCQCYKKDDINQKTQTLSMKTIINELDFLKKVIIK